VPGETQPLTRIPEPRPAMPGGWYARSPDAVAVALGVDPAAGLRAARAAVSPASGSTLTAAATSAGVRAYQSRPAAAGGPVVSAWTAM